MAFEWSNLHKMVFGVFWMLEQVSFGSNNSLTLSFCLKFGWIEFWSSKPQNWINFHVFTLDSMLEVVRFNSNSSLGVETKWGVSNWELNLVQNLSLGPRTPKLQVLHELCRIWFLHISPRRGIFAWARLEFGKSLGEGSFGRPRLGEWLFRLGEMALIRLGEAF